MALQWYRWRPELGRMEWQEAEERPGPDWESSDVPLFDSDLFPFPAPAPGEMWTVQEDPPVYLQEQDYPEFHQDRAVRRDFPPVTKGLFQHLPMGRLPAYEFRKAHPTEYRPPAPVLQLMQGEQEEQQGPTPEHLAAVRQWIRRYYPETAAALDEVAPLPPPVSLVLLAPSQQSPRVRAWWLQVHRLSSARRGRPAPPVRSAPRVAGHRREEGRR